jgi:hypothetical protein
MPKTAQDVGLIAAAVALVILTEGQSAPLSAGLFGGAITASTLAGVGMSAGMAGVFGLLQAILNPNDLSVPGSQQNSQDSAAFRRVIYGYAEVGGVKTYDSTPAGNNNFQNTNINNNYRHQVYTLSAAEVIGFGPQGAGSYVVVIDGIPTELELDTLTGYYIPVDTLTPFSGNTDASSDPYPIDGGIYSGQNTLLNGAHIGFEFDTGSLANEGQTLPLLAAACPDWTSACLQRGRAKVHVAMRYDVFADGSQLGTDALATSEAIYINGAVPSFRFQVLGKPIIDTRLPAGGGGPPAWQANTPFDFAQYIFDALNRVEVQTNGPLGIFVSGPTLPTFPPADNFPGGVTPDGECDWLNAGPVQPGSWPGPNQTIGYPYVFKDPNGNLQLYTGVGSGPPTEEWPLGTFVTGAAEPEWATVPGEYTPDGGESQGQQELGVVSANVTNPGGGYQNETPTFVFVQGPAFNAVGQANMVPGGGGSAPYNYQLGSITILEQGDGYTENFDCSGVLPFAQGAPFVNAHAEAIVGPVSGGGGGGNTPKAWLCLGVPTGYAYAANPSNPALIIYDYLTNTDYGEAADPSTIDIDSINAAANLCDEQVVVAIASNNLPVSENLYSCNGVFDYGAARGDVLKGLVASCAGWLIPPGDMWHLFAGAYGPPTTNLTDADLRGPLKGDFRISRRDICNGVKGTFMPSFLPTDSTQQQPMAWRWTDFPPYQGNGMDGTPNYIAEDGGQIIWKEVRFGFCTSIWQAQRLAKIVLQLLRFQVSLHLACKLTAFQVQAGDTITFTHARWAALADPPPTVFFVTQATLVIESQGGVPCLGVDLVLRETDPSIYEFAAPTLYQAPGAAWVVGDGEYSQYGSLGVL